MLFVNFSTTFEGKIKISLEKTPFDKNIAEIRINSTCSRPFLHVFKVLKVSRKKPHALIPDWKVLSEHTFLLLSTEYQVWCHDDCQVCCCHLVDVWVEWDVVEECQEVFEVLEVLGREGVKEGGDGPATVRSGGGASWQPLTVHVLFMM